MTRREHNGALLVPAVESWDTLLNSRIVIPIGHGVPVIHGIQSLLMLRLKRLVGTSALAAGRR